MIEPSVPVDLTSARERLSRATIRDEQGNVIPWESLSPEEQADIIEADAVGFAARENAVAQLHAAGRPAIFKDEAGIYELWPGDRKVYV